MIHDGDRVTIGTGPRPRVGDGGQRFGDWIPCTLGMIHHGLS